MSRRTLPILKQLCASSPSNPSPHPYLNLVRDHMLRPSDGTPRVVTLIPGDRIKPLVTGVVKQVFEAMHAPIYFERYQVHGDIKTVPAKVLDSIRRNNISNSCSLLF